MSFLYILRYNFFVEDTRYINGKAFLSTKDAATRFGKTPATIAKQCRSGLLDAQKVNGTWFVSASVCPVLQTPSVAAASTPVTSVSKAKKTISTPRVIVTLKKPILEPTVTAVASPIQTIPVVARSFIPTFYITSFSMIVGVALLVSVFFIGELPFMSQPLATLSRIDQPMRSLGQGALMLQSRLSAKTSTLATYSVATVSQGVTSLGQEIESYKQEPKEKVANTTARPSMLARAAASVPRISFREKITETAQLMAAAFMSLYQFETINTSIAHTTNSTWGCTFGFGTCPTKEVVPLRGVTVYDITTKRIHCLQVSNGVPTSTPGRCDVEDRE